MALSTGPAWVWKGAGKAHTEHAAQGRSCCSSTGGQLGLTRAHAQARHLSCEACCRPGVGPRYACGMGGGHTHHGRHRASGGTRRASKQCVGCGVPHLH
eukprot:352672-Chlamydomonas_euryale.AAC.2